MSVGGWRAGLVGGGGGRRRNSGNDFAPQDVGADALALRLGAAAELSQLVVANLTGGYGTVGGDAAALQTSRALSASNVSLVDLQGGSGTLLDGVGHGLAIQDVVDDDARGLMRLNGVVGIRSFPLVLDEVAGLDRLSDVVKICTHAEKQPPTTNAFGGRFGHRRYVDRVIVSPRCATD